MMDGMQPLPLFPSQIPSFSLEHPRDARPSTGSEVGGGEGTAEESPPAGLVTDETDYFRLDDDAELS